MWHVKITVGDVKILHLCMQECRNKHELSQSTVCYELWVFGTKKQNCLFTRRTLTKYVTPLTTRFGFRGIALASPADKLWRRVCASPQPRWGAFAAWLGAGWPGAPQSPTTVHLNEEKSCACQSPKSPASAEWNWLTWSEVTVNKDLDPGRFVAGEDVRCVDKSTPGDIVVGKRVAVYYSPVHVRFERSFTNV